MNEWSTYSLSDFLMFSERTYFRLIELYNTALWPFHLLALALGLALITGRPHSSRLRAILLGMAWLWVAWAYHAERYATINTAAPYFAAAFALQGALLVMWGHLGSGRDRAALALQHIALLGYPLLALLAGRPWQQAELFGLTPDPTVAVTLALLLRSGSPWWLWIMPLLWCAVSSATLSTMHLREAWVLPLLALAVLARHAYTNLRKPAP